MARSPSVEAFENGETDLPVATSAQQKSGREEQQPAASAAPRPNEHSQEESQLTSRKKLVLLVLTLSLPNVAIALDTSVIGPAIPALTNDFEELSHIGWYSSVYLLALLACQPSFSRLGPYFEPKWFFMVSTVGFGVGSCICALARISAVFILGRAVSGVGAAGIMSMALVMVGRVIPMRERPRMLALFGALQSVGLMLGPTVSGLLTDSPLTGVAICGVSLVLAQLVLNRRPSPGHHLLLLDKIGVADPLGAVLLASSLVALFLGLQLASTSEGFARPTAWAPLIGAAVAAVAAVCFGISLTFRPEKGLVPIRVLRQRTVASCCVFSMFLGAANTTHVTMIPVYLQTVHNFSAAMSGVVQLVMTVANIFCTVAVGLAMTKWGRYIPFLRAGPLLYLSGSVCVQQLRPDSSLWQIIIYQIVLGLGVGCSVQSSLRAVQNVTTTEDMPVAITMEIVCNNMGRAVGVSIAQTIFVRGLSRQLPAVQEHDTEEAGGFGLTALADFIGSLEPDLQQRFRDQINTVAAESLLVPVAALVVGSIAVWFAEAKLLQGAPQ